MSPRSEASPNDVAAKLDQGTEAVSENSCKRAPWSATSTGNAVRG